MSLAGAFDAVAFGPAKTLDLHGFREVDDALRHAEQWLRERQVAKAGTVLVITGRGARSADGVAVLRPAVERLLGRLRRKGVVAQAHAHGDGAFTVALAPVTSLFEVPRRSRSRSPVGGGSRQMAGPALAGLSDGTRAALRLLAERTLESLGAPVTADLVEDEMQRQFSLLAPSLPPEEDPDRALRRVARDAMESMEDR